MGGVVRKAKKIVKKVTKPITKIVKKTVKKVKKIGKAVMTATHKPCRNVSKKIISPIMLYWHAQNFLIGLNNFVSYHDGCFNGEF